MFLELSCIFNDPADVGNLISGSSAFSKTSLNLWKFTVHLLLKPGLENFEHYFTSVWDECNCAVVWAFFDIAFLWDWNENWPVPGLWPLLIFLLAILIPACDSSSPAFLMMYSAHKLNKQGDNIQPWRTPFPIWKQSVVPCPVLTVASWPAYRFLKRQVRWSCIPISLRIFHILWWSTQSLWHSQ